MDELRRGRQTPTQSLILPYEKTYGADAVELYDSSGRKAFEWQELVLYDILAVNAEGLWVHSRFGFAVPRRNGKNEIVVMREMYGLQRGEHILHTAHRTTTTHSAWERLLNSLEKAKIEVVSSYRAFGKEHIELANGGKVEFRTRTSKGGLGEGFDLLVIDEAQEYQDDQESALKYVVSDSQNPQTIFTGTPPTPVSSGTVFVKYRASVLEGNTENSGWAEWSVDHETDPNEVEAWYETNPSMGTILTERKVRDEIGDRIDFNIQRLGFWIRYNQHSAISAKEWEALQAAELPQLKGELFAGIKYGHDGRNVSLAIAVRTREDKIFVECVDCRELRAGNTWIIDFLKAAQPAIRKIVIDGANGQQLLADEMKDQNLKPSPVLPTVKQIILANAAFEQGLFSTNIVHAGQPSLVQAATNCEKRAIGFGGGFGYKAAKEGVEIALLDSIILAHWICSETKAEKVKQKISY